MSNTITPTVFYRTLNVEGLEIFYREASQKTSSAAGPGRHGAPEDVAGTGLPHPGADHIVAHGW
jgi:hypothetical protein